MGLDCSGCRKPKDRCVCFKSSRVPLGPRPTARSTDTAPRVSRLPSTVRPTATTGRVSPAASVRATTTATPALERTPTNYSNVAYKGLVDLPYNNTGPDYDPSRAGLTATQERLRTGLTEIDRGRRDLAGRYEQLELRNQKIQGNHSDVPTYGRDSLYRTASDTVTHDAYHDKDHTRMLEDATKAVGPAKEAKGAQLNSKAPDSMPHVQVVQVMRTAQDAHLKNADARMTYMEAYPNGLNDARSHRTHVGAAKDSLQSAVNYERDIKTQSQSEHRHPHPPQSILFRYLGTEPGNRPLDLVTVN
ncbi:hypothetical protein B0I37DRAFT_196304 [Chaetomium sp. MPI-CAGE-AT-0009]|nr:hypothetical protein B0I37DRAFT_196304 [Chaetomium sp. MPI-CAGE-AT-0009]